MSDEARVLGLVAGAGALPRVIAEARAAQGRPVFVCAFEGAAPGWIDAYPHVVTPFERPGALFRALREAGVDAVAFAGAMTRPRLRPLRFDATAARLAPGLLPLLRHGGDDALLRAVAGLFEREGFRVIGAHELAPGALAPKGAFSAAAPDAEALRDIAHAAKIVHALGRLEVGQGAVVAHGHCLGIETMQGTDAMLAFVARSRAERPDLPVGGALYKGPKPGQDRRLDLPAIGPATLGAAAEAGLAGVAVEAEGALLLEPEALRAEADRLGLFLWGRRADAQ